MPKMISCSQDSIVVCYYIHRISSHKLILKHCFPFYIVESSHTPHFKKEAPIALGFLHLPRRRVFLLDPIKTWEQKHFEKKQGVQEWPLFCQTDTSTQTLKVRSYLPVHLRRTKQCDINLSYFMTIKFTFKQVHKIN